MTNDNDTITIADIIKARKLLADVLSEETFQLGAMKIKKVAALQDLKLSLIAQLERYTLHLSKTPHLLSGMTLAEKEDMKAVNSYFDRAMRENYEKLLVAKTINQTIVTCITGLFASNTNSHAYNRKGIMGGSRPLPVSVTLNRVV